MKHILTPLLRNNLPENKSLSIHRALLLFGSLSLLNVFQILMFLVAERKFLPAITLKLLFHETNSFTVPAYGTLLRLHPKDLEQFNLHWKGRLKPPFLLNQSKAYSFTKWWRASCKPHQYSNKYVNKFQFCSWKHPMHPVGTAVISVLFLVGHSLILSRSSWESFLNISFIDIKCLWNTYFVKKPT